MKTVNKNLLAAASCVGPKSRPVLSGVKFKNGKLVATDSYKLIEIGLSKGFDAQEFPVKDQKIIEDEPSFILSGEAITKNVRFKKRSKTLPILNEGVLCNENDRTVQIMQTDLEVMSAIDIPKIEGNYPEHEHIFPQGEGQKVKLNINYLRDLINAFAKAGSREVTIEIRSNLDPIVLLDPENEIRGLVMPLKS